MHTFIKFTIRKLLYVNNFCYQLKTQYLLAKQKLKKNIPYTWYLYQLKKYTQKHAQVTNNIISIILFSKSCVNTLII